MAKRYTKNEDRQDIYTHVTAAIVEQLEHGARPWVQPWSTGRHVAGPITMPRRADVRMYSAGDIGLGVLGDYASLLIAFIDAVRIIDERRSQK